MLIEDPCTRMCNVFLSSFTHFVLANSGVVIFLQFLFFLPKRARFSRLPASFVCVQYFEDRKRALLLISLVKNFQPSTSRDFNKQKTVLAYWVGEAGESEGYY